MDKAKIGVSYAGFRGFDAGVGGAVAALLFGLAGWGFGVWLATRPRRLRAGCAQSDGGGLEDCGIGTGAGEGDADATGGFDDAGGDLDQPGPQRKAAATGALASVPAVARTALASHPDAAIVAALQRWRDAVRSYAASPLDMESDGWLALVGHANAALAAVAAMPARTIDGLAIKAHMALLHEYGGRRGNELVPNFSGGLMADQTLPKSLGADLLRLSPVLAAAVA